MKHARRFLTLSFLISAAVLFGADRDIAARGPDSFIPNDASATARITSFGDEGPILLEGEWTNSILQIQQNVATGAVVRTFDGVTNKTLLVSALKIADGQSDLTIGENEGDGSVSSLTSGSGLLLDNQSASAVLTVNADFVNNTTASTLSKTGRGKAVLKGANAYSGATSIAEGELAFGGSSTQTLAGVISGAGSLVREGTGRLALTAANTYTGPTLISGGMVLASNNAALGSSAAGTFISNGGTLDIGGSSSDQAMNLNAEQITVSGAGVNGRGAIINGSARSQYNALRLVSLSGDTTFGGDASGARWDLRNVNGTSTLAMNGHTLTKVGSNLFGLTGVSVTPDGDAAAIDIKEGGVTVEVGTTLGGSSANTLTVRNGAYFDFYSVYSRIAWSMVMDDGARLFSRSGNNTNQSIWAGPVALSGSGRMDGGGSSCFSLSGVISGETGNIIKTGAGSITYFTGENNTYGGLTSVSNGMLYAKYPGSLPGYDTGKLTVAPGGTLAVYASNGSVGWSAGQIRTLYNASTFTAVNAALGIDTGFASMDYPYDITNRMGLTKLGNNTLTFSGANTYRGDTRVYGGNLVFNGSGNQEIGTLYVGNGALFLTNDAPMCVYVDKNNAYIGDASTDLGRMTVGGNTAWGGYLYTQNITQTTLFIGNSGRGVLTLQDNASITQKLYVGNNAGSAGAVYQNGGKMHNWGGSASDPRIGMNGYGYYELNSGTFTNNGYTQLGCYYTGVGILKQTGGAFEMGSRYSGQLGISRGGTGVVYLAGGTFSASVGINVGEASDYGLIRGFAEFTVDGGSAFINGNVNMADRTNMFATVNLNGGTLAANQISKSSSRTGSLALVNFDGGTFRSRVSGNIFNTGANTPDVVNVYAGGATFDTTNFACAIRSGLLAPVGNGLASVSITPRSGYIGPPHVFITGGGGTGATAVAQFDSASGWVNGINITCPGFGYTSVPTVVVSGGGITNQYAAVAALGANVSGGLTKLGSGSLTLMATNTYAGATTVSNGLLSIAVAAALPTGTDINVNGGILDLGGFTLTNGAITASAGSIINGSLVSDSFTKVGNATLTLATPLAATEPIKIESGIMRLQGAQSGLFEAPVNGSFNVTDDMTTSIVTRLTTRMANIVYAEPYNVTWIYRGFVWNRAATNETWTFAENFDDNVKLTIDTTVMMTNGVSWNVPTISSIALTPGPHAFEVRFGQGIGGGGPVNSDWWKTTAFGLGVDFRGRNETNIANFISLTDPGDGSLLTTAAYASNPLSVDSSLAVSEGAVLDLGGNVQSLDNLSGSGAVSNGTLTVTGTLAPGGEGLLGDLTLACDATLSGVLLVDLGATDNDALIVKGSLALSTTSTLVVANPELLDTQKTYTIASASSGGQIRGAIEWTSPPNSHWKVALKADGSLKLYYVSSTVILLR